MGSGRWTLSLQRRMAQAGAVQEWIAAVGAKTACIEYLFPQDLVVGGAVMRSAISAFAGLALAGSFAFAQPSDGHLKIIHETATLRVAYRTDSRPFSYVDAQGRPVGYTIELCERIARSLEAQLNVALTIKWMPVDERTRFDAIVNDTADMECGSTTVSLSRMKIVDFSSVVFADSTGVLVKSGRGLITFDNMAGKNIGVIAGTTNAQAVRDQLARR